MCWARTSTGSSFLTCPWALTKQDQHELCMHEGDLVPAVGCRARAGQCLHATGMSAILSQVPGAAVSCCLCWGDACNFCTAIGVTPSSQGEGGPSRRQLQESEPSYNLRRGLTEAWDVIWFLWYLHFVGVYKHRHNGKVRAAPITNKPKSN